MGFFGVDSVHSLDTIQLSLLDWIQFYDSLFGMSDDERPTDATIRDDEALDAWLNKRKADMSAQKMRSGSGYMNPANLPGGKTIGG